jgi:hypothetical protein
MSEFDGFLCRGGLPECRWMNVPEALFLSENEHLIQNGRKKNGQ